MPNRALLAISLTTCLLWASPVAAQSRPRSGDDRIQSALPRSDPFHGAIVQVDPQDNAAAKYDQMAEDMEIMAHIIRAAVEEAYGSDSLRMSAIKHSDLRTARGVFDSLESDKRSKRKITKPYSAYVKGHGVVFQLEAPPLRKPAQQEESAEADDGPRPSTWERTRMLLRGEIKPADLQAAGCMQCHSSASNLVGRWHQVAADEVHRGVWLDQPASQMQKRGTSAPTVHELADKLIRLLSENGRNLRGLAPEERVTIAVTFRERSPDESTITAAKSSRRSHWAVPLAIDFDPGLKNLRQLLVDPGRDSKESVAKDKKDDKSQDANQSQSPPSGAAGGSNNVFPVEIKQWISRSSKSFNLMGLATVPSEEVEGDLHMRQENYTKAIESYAKAAKHFLKGDPDTGYDFESMADFNRPNVGRLLRKLCQAQLGLGELQKSNRLLEQLNTLARRIAGGEKNPENGKKSLVLPSRLTISATKKELGSIAPGNAGGAERRKYPHVQERGGVEFYVPSES